MGKIGFFKPDWASVLKSIEIGTLHFYSGVQLDGNNPTIIFSKEKHELLVKELSIFKAVSIQFNRKEYEVLKKLYPEKMKEIYEKWVQKNTIDAKNAEELDVPIKKKD